jgi:hypothetical protein
MKDFLLETFPNPERIGCPNEQVLQALAEGQPPADETVRFHVGSCSECYAEYRHYHLDWLEAQPAETALHSSTGFHEASAAGGKPGRSFFSPTAVALFVAAALIVTCAGMYVVSRHQNPTVGTTVQIAESSPVAATVDLWNSGTSRSIGDDATPLQEVSLPAAVVQLEVILPRFSETGTYSVKVSSDKSGNQVIAEGTGEAIEKDHGKVKVGVSLDLRRAKRGAYFLATVRGTDNGTYYYPLKIK